MIFYCDSCRLIQRLAFNTIGYTRVTFCFNCKHKHIKVFFIKIIGMDLLAFVKLYFIFSLSFVDHSISQSEKKMSCVLFLLVFRLSQSS